MAVVYKAHQSKLDRFVALKLILSGTHASKEEIVRFRAEAETVARLRHPNIVQIYDIGEVDGRLYLSLEYVEGGSLSRLIHDGVATPQEAASLAETLARTMHYCHQEGVIHRDLKPANILLERVRNEERGAREVSSGDSSIAPSFSSFLLKITDFGVAKRLDVPLGLTRTGVIAGTPAYMAPEQAAGTVAAIGPSVDVYALGAILYEVLIGRPPFSADTPMEIIFQVLHDEPVSMRRLRPNVPRDLEIITFKCLQKEPSRRYASCLALAEDLRRFQSGDSIQAMPPSHLYRCVRFAKRNRAIVGGIAATLATLVIGLFVSILFAVGESRARRKADENASQATLARQAAHRETYQARLGAAQEALSDHNLEEAGRHLASAPESLRGWEWNYLHSRFTEESPTVHELNGLYGWVQNFSSSGQFVLMNNNGHYRLIDGRTGEPVRVFQKSSICLSASTSAGFQILVKEPGKPWTFEDQNRRVEPCLVAIDREPHALGLSPDFQRMAACWELPGKLWEVRCFDLTTGKLCGKAWTGSFVRQLVFSPNGRLVAGACHDGKVRTWEIATGALVEYQAGTSEARTLSFTPDGSRLISGGFDGVLREWELATGIMTVRRGHQGIINSVAYSSDGLWLASAGDDNCVRLWSTEGGGSQVLVQDLAIAYERVAFSADNRTVIGAGRGIGSERSHRMVFWTIPSQADPRVLRAHNSYVYPVVFSPDGQWFASGGWDKTLRLWDTASRKLVGEIPTFDTCVLALAISPDGSRLVARSLSQVNLWEKESLKRLAEFNGRPVLDPHLVYTMAFSPDGAVLVWAEGDRVRRWDCNTNKELQPLTPPIERSRLVAFSPDGNQLAIGGFAAEVLIVNPDTGQVQCKLASDGGIVRFLAFSPDGKRFVTAGSDRLLRLWDATSFTIDAHPTPLATFIGHTQEIFAVAFHPDGTRLASGGRDRTVHIWDTATGDELIRLPGHTSYIFSLAFSPDGRMLVSGSGITRCESGILCRCKNGPNVSQTPISPLAVKTRSKERDASCRCD